MSGTFLLIVQALYALPGLSGYGLRLLLAVSSKGTLVLLFALLSVLALGRACAAARHGVWTLALIAMLALPIAAITVPAWDFPILPSVSTGTASAGTSSTRRDFATGEMKRHVPPNLPRWLPVAVTSARGAHPVWPRWMLGFWAAGVFLFAARVAVGVVRVKRLTQRSRPLDSGASQAVVASARAHLCIIRPVKIRTSSEIATPFTWGALRPTILVPESTDSWSSKHWEFVLAHELAHVKRFDYLAQMAAEVTCALFWFHPLVWLAARQIRQEGERACDDLVLSLNHKATDYAEFLLFLSRRLPRLDARWLASAVITHSSQLEVRMKALLDSGLNHKPIAPSRALLGTALALAFFLPVAAMHATARNALGTVSVTVRDPSGAVVPGAEITLVNNSNREKIVAQTGEDGQYRFRGVAVGRYQIEVAKPGFAPAKSPDEELEPSNELHWDAVLEIGSLLEEVVVHGHKPAENPPAPHAPTRIRVGGLVQAAKLISQQKPEYPEIMQKEGIEGTVVLRAVIGIKGDILSLSAASGPDPSLIQAAMDAVSQWRYQPTLLNGAPVEVATTIEVAFQLDD